MGRAGASCRRGRFYEATPPGPALQPGAHQSTLYPPSSFGSVGEGSPQVTTRALAASRYQRPRWTVLLFSAAVHDWMEEQGLAIWLIPSEFMDVNYGVTLRRYLTLNVTLLHIHRFCPTDAQFTDALVSSAVVVFRKSPPPAGHAARFSFAGPIEHPRTEAQVPLA